jgi:hypothetical protein
MVSYNLEYSVLDKLGRAKNTHHVGVYRTEEDVEKAKVSVQEANTDHSISFQVYIIDDPFFKMQ